MTSRKYPRLSDGYHERSPYHPYQSSGKYPKNHNNSVSEAREDASHGSNSSGYSSRGGSPASRSYTASPRTYHSKSGHGRAKESIKKGSSRSPDNHHSSTHRSNSSGSADREYGKNSHAPQEDDFPWSQHVSSSGKVYYYNCKTEKSQWEKPREWIDREIRLAKEKEKRERDGHIKEGRSVKDIRENSSHPKEYKTVKEHIQFRDLQYSKSKSSVSSTGIMSSKTSSREHYNPQPNDVFKTKDVNKFNSVSAYSDKERVSGNSEALRRQEIITKTQSAHTTAVPTTIYRGVTFPAGPYTDSSVSPAGSLQDVSPPATPSCPTSIDPNIQSISPQFNSTPPQSVQQHAVNSPSVMHQQTVSPTVHHQHNSSSPMVTPVNFLLPHSMETIPEAQSGYYGSSQSTHILPTVSKSVTNYPPQLTATPLHPLQQATLLQQRKISETHIIHGMQPQSLSVNIPDVLHNDGISKPILNSSNNHSEQRSSSSSCPVSPVQFQQSVSSHHFLPIPSKQPIHQPQHSTNSPHVLSPLPSPTPLSLPPLGRFYEKNLIMNTIISPQIEIYEKQAQKAWDETIVQSEDGLQVKGDLLQAHLNLYLADLKGDIGSKRIVFLREQTRTLDALLSESNTKSLM